MQAISGQNQSMAVLFTNSLDSPSVVFYKRQSWNAEESEGRRGGLEWSLFYLRTDGGDGAGESSTNNETVVIDLMNSVRYVRYVPIDTTKTDSLDHVEITFTDNKSFVLFGGTNLIDERVKASLKKINENKETLVPRPINEVLAPYKHTAFGAAMGLGHWRWGGIIGLVKHYKMKRNLKMTAAETIFKTLERNPKFHRCPGPSGSTVIAPSGVLCLP